MTAFIIIAAAIVLVLGFAAQPVLQDVITGLFIKMDCKTARGDIISVGGFRGKVTAFGLFSLRIIDMGGNIMVIRYSGIKDIVNLSGQLSTAVVDIPVDSSERVEYVERVIKKALPIIHKRDTVLFKAEPVYVGVQQLGHASMDLRVTAQVAERDIYNACRTLNRELKIAFEENNIELLHAEADARQQTAEEV